MDTHFKSNKLSSLIILIATVFILFILKSLIVPLVLAIIFAIMIFPIQKKLEKKMKCNRLLATIISIIIIFVITTILLFVIGTQLYFFVDNSEVYISKLDDLYTRTILFFEDMMGVKRNASLLNDEINFGALIKGNFDKLSSFIAGWGTLMTDLVLIPIYMFFFLYYRRFFRNFSYKLFKNETKSFLNSIISKIYNVQRNYLLGLIKVILIVGTLNSIGLLILGINNAIFFGFFGAFLIIIPYVGVFIGSILPAVVALATKDSYWFAVGVISIFTAIQFIEGYFITPKVIGAGVSVNAFIAIVSLIVFAMLWGVSGMVVALPITATLKVLFDNSTDYKAIGFLIGEPEDKFLKSTARARLKKWKLIRSKNK